MQTNFVKVRTAQGGVVEIEERALAHFIAGGRTPMQRTGEGETNGTGRTGGQRRGGKSARRAPRSSSVASATGAGKTTLVDRVLSTISSGAAFTAPDIAKTLGVGLNQVRGPIRSLKERKQIVTKRGSRGVFQLRAGATATA